MRIGFIKVIALLLVICLCFTGCGSIGDYFSMLADFWMGRQRSFSDMEYIHPEISDFRQALENCCDAAENQTDLDELLQQILQFNAAYDTYATARALAMIHYCTDMTDAYWEQEYLYCEQLSTEIAAGIDRLYRILAESHLREQLEREDYFGADFFDAYEGTTLFDETFISLLEQETALKNQYYAIYGDAGDTQPGSDAFWDAHGQEMAQLLVELVQLRRQISTHAGYDDYTAFAYDFYYARDFSAQQTTAYLADIRAELVPLYNRLAGSEDLEILLHQCNEEETFTYVQQTAEAMGGMVHDAFLAMTELELYDISSGAHKYNASFEIYIPGYQLPYVFLNPSATEQDKLTFAHEFGHFCSDYASYGSIAGVDVAEIFSQSMEYLSLCYGPEDANLQQLKLLDSLCIYVEQAALASFEQQLYSLPADELTSEAINALYQQTCSSFGLTPGYSYVFITHFYTNPLYVISYVLSNDAALQIYQMELSEAGAGADCFQQNLIPQQPQFLAFLEEAGLESPFADGRLQAVKRTLEQALLP